LVELVVPVSDDGTLKVWDVTSSVVIATFAAAYPVKVLCQLITNRNAGGGR
jgi:hypothetical protein